MCTLRIVSLNILNWKTMKQKNSVEPNYKRKSNHKIVVVTMFLFLNTSTRILNLRWTDDGEPGWFERFVFHLYRFPNWNECIEIHESEQENDENWLYYMYINDKSMTQRYIHTLLTEKQNKNVFFIYIYIRSQISQLFHQS